MAFSGYLYSGLWLIIAIYLFYLGFKENKFLFVVSAFFFYMSGWYLINELLPNVDMFSGVYALVFRGIAVAFLVVCIIAYIRYRKIISDYEKKKKDE